jgi:phosphatidate cytidylyltransferase
MIETAKAVAPNEAPEPGQGGPAKPLAEIPPAGRGRLAGWGRRVVTAAVGVPLFLVAVFLLPPLGFFAVAAVLFGWASREFVAIARVWAPAAPLAALPPLAVVSGTLLGLEGAELPWPPLVPWLAAAALSVGIGTLVLWSRTPVAQAPAALGVFAFGIPYFGLPIGSLCQLHRQDPWLVFLLAAVVWLGDTAAYWVGSMWGRRPLAPVVSPRKTWEGAVAGFVVALVVAAVWSLWRLGRFDGEVLAVGAATAVAAQVGDLVESIFKRSVHIKDSGSVLPGHGGVLDRADALLFAAPVFWVGLQAAGFPAPR